MDCVAILTNYLLSGLQDGAISTLSYLRNLVTGGVLNLVNLGKTAHILDQKMTGLSELRDDVVGRVDLAEIQPRMKRTRQVEGWIGRVELLERRVDAFRSSFELRRTILEACSFECVHSNYMLGQESAKLLVEANELKGQGDGLGELVMEAPPDAVVAVPTAARIVGVERTWQEIESYIEDEKVGVIGVYGMGGVGKTTLLKRINNQFLHGDRSKAFDIVIFLTAGKDVNILKLQDDIGVRLGISRNGLPLDDADRRNVLYGTLCRKRFMLLFDDVWTKLDLDEIGIPNPDTTETKSNCKVIFTTRMRDLCLKMEAQKTVKVDCLDLQDSWELFRSKVEGEADLISEGSPLRPLVIQVVIRCGGLPLALVTMGRAMAGAVMVQEWEDAVACLQESPEEIEDMNKEVFSVLKFSYDRLEDDNVRECFLYCCLFQEDGGINTKELIEYWIGEGFIDPNQCRGSLDRARRRGRQVLDRLKTACLLESVRFYMGVEYVRMHDVVRDMALWLANGGVETNLFLAKEESAFDNIERWEMAKRILVHKKIYTNLDQTHRVPVCHNLQTLLMRGVKISHVGDEFFKFMPTLHVLDISGTLLEELPKEIGLLHELRYLNLSHNSFKSLPEELGNLSKLKLLDLSSSLHLKQVPNGAILRLTELQVLNLDQCPSINWELPDEDKGEYDVEDQAISLIRGIKCYLKRLQEFGVPLNTSGSLSELAGCDKLSKCTRFLTLVRMSGLTCTDLSNALERLEGLRQLSISFFIESCLEELNLVSDKNQLQCLEYLTLVSLCQVRIVPPPTHRRCLQKLVCIFIFSCDGFRDLSWIQHLPCLELLSLLNCEELEELLAGIGGEDVDEINSGGNVCFPKLRSMDLASLPKLRSISQHALLLPSLQVLSVRDCPQLTRLPFGAGSAKNLQALRGEQDWFDRLEWEYGDGLKDIYAGFFHSL